MWPRVARGAVTHTRPVVSHEEPAERLRLPVRSRCAVRRVAVGQDLRYRLLPEGVEPLVSSVRARDHWAIGAAAVKLASTSAHSGQSVGSTVGGGPRSDAVDWTAGWPRLAVALCPPCWVPDAAQNRTRRPADVSSPPASTSTASISMIARVKRIAPPTPIQRVK